MLPSFDQHGNLPPGIHHCTVEELVARFGSGSEDRVTETQELVELIAWALRPGVARLLVNGSYVTAKVSPNDADVVVLAGPDYPRDESLAGREEILFSVFAHLDRP